MYLLLLERQTSLRAGGTKAKAAIFAVHHISKLDDGDSSRNGGTMSLVTKSPMESEGFTSVQILFGASELHPPSQSELCH